MKNSIKIPDMNILKTAITCILGCCALNAAPATDVANFGKYETDNKRVMGMPNTGTRVVFMGNSITELWPTTHPEFFAINDFIGRGISGQTTFEMLMRFREDVVRLEPAGVVISGGTNDVAQNLYPWYDEERTMGNLMSMAEIAKANGIQVFLASVLPVTSYQWNPSIIDHKGKIENLNKRIKAYGEANDIPYIDYYSAMVYGDRNLNYAWTGDGVHPNAEGYSVMEGIVLPVIRERIKFKGSTIPETVTLSGAAVAETSPVQCTKVSMNAFEAFVELKSGVVLEIKDENGKPYFIKDGRIEETGSDVLIQKSGVYCVSLDFLNKAASLKEVTSMCVLNCFTKKSMADLSYEGDGKWSGEWNVDLAMPWGVENRYRMMMTVGGEQVNWGSTLGTDKEPDGSEAYFHMTRVVPAGTWANTWCIPISFNGQTVRVTAIMRGTYTHNYDQVASVANIEAAPSQIISHDAAGVVCLSDVVVCDMAGSIVAKVSKGELIRLPDGVYIAKAETGTQKFAVKH